MIGTEDFSYFCYCYICKGNSFSLSIRLFWGLFMHEKRKRNTLALHFFAINPSLASFIRVSPSHKTSILISSRIDLSFLKILTKSLISISPWHTFLKTTFSYSIKTSTLNNKNATFHSTKVF